MRKLFFYLLFLFFFVIPRAFSQAKSGETFFVGTYTDGQSEGIYQYMLHKDGSLDSVKLATKTDNSSFLTLSSPCYVFVNSSGYVLTANQKPDNIVSFKRNKHTGHLQYVDVSTAPKPVCILFLGS